MKTYTLCFCAILLLFTGCPRATTKTRVQEGNLRGILHLGNGDEPESLDPHLTTGVPEYNIISGLMEGLIREDPKTLAPTPGVASRWDISEDGKTYVFHLRPEAKWSNGDPVTAEDFVFSFRRILSPKLAAEYAYMLHILKNAKDYNEERLDDPAAIGVHAADAHTLVVELENPAPYFLGMLNHHSYYPVHAATLRKHGDPENRDNPWARPGNYVGNGPFTLVEWKINQHIQIAKSPTYWNQERVRLNAIFFYPIQDEQTEENMFRAGLLHKTENVPLTRIDSYRNAEKAVFRSHPYLTTYYYIFNTARKPFDDVRVRQALSLALQREVITERVLKAGQLPARWFTPPGTGGFEPSQQLTEDLAEAKRLLAEAGYPDGKGFPKFSILYNTRESHRSIAQVIQQMWKQNLGIDCELINQEWQVYMVSRRDKNFDVARAGWAGDYADPHTFLDLHLSGGGNNHSGWSDPAYDALIASATAERDNTRRFTLYDQAEAILLRDMPVLPIYWYTRNYLIVPSVKGWDTNILDRHDYCEVWLDPSAL